MQKCYWLGDPTDARTTGMGETKKEQTNYGKNFLLMSKKIMNHSHVFAVLQTILWKKLALRKRQKIN